MKFLSRNSLAIAIALGILVPLSAHATNGMNMIGYGSRSTGMGGVGVAYPQDGLAAAANPASIAAVAQGRWDATVELFSPKRSAAHDSALLPTDERSMDELFLIPAVGMVMADPDEDIAFGFAMIGAGLGTNYHQTDGTFFDPAGGNTAYNRVGVNLIQAQMLPTAAYKLNENNTVGASLVIAVQVFRAFGLETFVDLGFTNSDEGLTNNNSDWSTGFGARLGWFGQFFDKKLNLGVNYAPRVNMQPFEKYKGLFANHGEFDIPESYAVGAAFKVTPTINVAFDVQRINWSEVDSIGNPGPNAADPSDINPLCPGVDTPDCLLGGDRGMGFGWEDQTVYKLGADYKYSKSLTLRAGLNYGKAPIPKDQVLFNMLAPGTTEKHITFGGTYALDKKSELTMHFMHAFENTISGPTAFPPSGSTVTVGENAAISMVQTSIGIAYGSKF